MDEGADVSGERRAVADDLPWNGGLCGDARLVDHECAEGGETEDEGHEDLGGVPREADTTESQASHGHRGTGNDEEVTAVDHNVRLWTKRQCNEKDVQPIDASKLVHDSAWRCAHAQEDRDKAEGDTAERKVHV